MKLTTGSFCSGIAAPECAWKTLGWQARWFSEIEPFATAVLAQRFPGVPNLGDMEKINGKELEPVDVVCAGTPCQSFSVAGLRTGMDDPRGNLALVFLRLIDRLRPRWVVWENVPGVLSSGDGRDFGAFLGALGQLGYGWAYRVLDAQYLGVPQRRRRAFVVGYLGDWRRAAAVLFERHSLSGNPAPSREARQRVAASLTRGADSSGKGGYAGRRREDDYNIVNALDAHMGGGGPDDNAAQARHLIPADLPDVCPAIKARDFKGPSSDGDGDGAILVPMVSHSLSAEGFDASEDGTGRGTPIISILEAGKRCGLRDSARNGLGIGADNDPMFTLQAGTQHAVGLQMNFIRKPRVGDYCGSLSAAPGNAQFNGVWDKRMGVRRLTPLECERLQGFPDEFTLINYRGKPASDGPRYRAIGNSMAVPVVRWIGERIGAVEAIRGGA